MSDSAAANLPNMKLLERTTVFVIVFVTMTMIFITVSPYFGLHPSGDVSSISQQSTVIQNVFISIVSFLIGASVGTRKKDDTIAVQAITAAAAQDKLAPIPGAPVAPTIPIAAGEVKIIKGEEAKP